jgi:hypothetical protein
MGAIRYMPILPNEEQQRKMLEHIEEITTMFNEYCKAIDKYLFELEQKEQLKETSKSFHKLMLAIDQVVHQYLYAEYEVSTEDIVYILEKQTDFQTNFNAINSLVNTKILNIASDQPVFRLFKQFIELFEQIFNFLNRLVDDIDIHGELTAEPTFTYFIPVIIPPTPNEIESILSHQSKLTFFNHHTKATCEDTLSKNTTELNDYISHLAEKKESFQDAFTRLQIEPSDSNICIISHDVPNKPVLLNNTHLYDYDNLLKLPMQNNGYRSDPMTRKPFTLQDVTPAYDICEKLEDQIQAKASQTENIPSTVALTA